MLKKFIPNLLQRSYENVLLDILRSVDKKEIDTKILDYKKEMEDRPFIDIKELSSQRYE